MERTLCRSAQSLRRRCLVILGMPLKSREQSRERTSRFGEAIADDRRPNEAERERSPVAIDDDVRDPRLKALDDVSEERLAGERQKRLVGASHAARFAARENDASNLPR
jgi:hypothetical protein